MSGKEPWEDWISVPTIARLYGDGIRLHGGKWSDPKPGCVEAALGAAYNAELYSTPEIEPDGLIKGLVFAGYLLFYLNTKHCYVDGDKRVAWTCAMFVLLKMGLTVQVEDEDAESLCLKVAKGEITDGSEVVCWISDRLVEIV